MAKAEFTPLVVERAARIDRLPKTPSKSSLRIRWGLTDSWALESIAFGLSISASVAIIVTLSIYDGHALSTWSHTISLNTVLSTLGISLNGFLMITIASCLGQSKWLWYSDKRHSLHEFQIFDQASRGPWGSILLLWNLRLRYLPCMGAIVTLLALASDAFIQQSVSYPSRGAVQSNLTSSVPYTYQYVDYNITAQQPIHRIGGPATPVITNRMLKALYDGLLLTNTDISSSLQTVCPSGDCTFPPYASLGVCSKCTNVTSLIKSTPEVSGRKFILPNGLSAYSGSFSTATNASTELPLNSDTLSEYAMNGALVNFSIIASPIANVYSEAFLNEFVGVDCVLFMCARAYNSSISSNIYHEHVVNSIEHPNWDIIENTSPVTTSENPYGWASFEGHLPEISPHSLTFEFNPSAQQALATELKSLLYGTATFLSSSGKPGYNFSGDVMGALFQSGLGVSALFGRIENIARALTNAMRELGDTVVGETHSPQTYIAVHWPWLILPLAMQLLALIYLLLILAQTKHSRVPSWRTSALATMEHGFSMLGVEGDEDAPKIDVIGMANGKETVGELEDWAKNVDVRLQRRGENASKFGLNVA